MVLYQIGADLKSNMAARVHNVFSLAVILKIFLSETTKSIELWLCSINHIISLKICKERSWLVNFGNIIQSEQLYYMYFEVNCKQKVIFIQCSQRVLYVHVSRVLSIIRAWFLFYVKHILQYVNGHAGPAANHWQTLSHNVVSSIPRLSGIRTHNFSGSNISSTGIDY
jgi:hypothetical protein